MDQPKGTMENKFTVSPRGKIFLSVVVVETILLLVDRFFISSPMEDRDSMWFFGITLINLLFCGYLAFSAVLTENKYEMIAFFFAATILAIRVALDYLWRDDECKEDGLLGICVTSVAIVGFLYIFYLCLGYTIIKQMGWKFFRQAGSEVLLRELYIAYQGFLSCLKLDFQMVVVMLFTGLFYSEIQEFKFGVILALIMSVLEVLWEITGLAAVRLENPMLFRLFFVLGLLLTPSYTTVYMIHFSAYTGFDGVFTKITIIAVFALINRLALCYFGIRVYLNFGKGLRSKVFTLPAFRFASHSNQSETNGHGGPNKTNDGGVRVEIIDENEDSSKHTEPSENDNENSQFPPSNSVSVVSPIGGAVSERNSSSRVSVSSSFPPPDLVTHEPNNNISREVATPKTSLIPSGSISSDAIIVTQDIGQGVRPDGDLDNSNSGFAPSTSGNFNIPYTSMSPGGTLPPIQL